MGRDTLLAWRKDQDHRWLEKADIGTCREFGSWRAKYGKDTWVFVNDGWGWRCYAVGKGGITVSDPGAWSQTDPTMTLADILSECEKVIIPPAERLLRSLDKEEK